MQRSSSTAADADKLFVPIALAIILLGRLLGQLLLYRSGFESLTADEFGRTLLAAQWAQQPYASWAGVWLPLHLYMFGSALRLKWELIMVPRLIVAVWGAAGVVLLYCLTTTLFRSRTMALLGACLLAVNPVHLWLSATPLTEVPQTTLVLGALTSFAVFLRREHYRWLYGSAVLLACANGFRFESWMLSIIWSIYVVLMAFLHRRRRGETSTTWRLIAAAALPWTVPGIWLIGNYLITGDPLFFLRSIKAYKLTWYGTDSSYGRYVDTFLRIDPYATLLVVIGVLACLFQREPDATSRRAIRWFALMAVAPFVIFAYLHGGQSEPPGNYLRYLAPFLFVTYPAAAYVIYRASRMLVKTPALQTALVMLAGCVIALSQLQAAAHFVNDPSAMGLKVGQHMRELRRQDASIAERPILLELSYWQYLAIHVGANDVSRLVYDRPLNLAQRQAPSLFQTDLDQMRSCLASYDMSYVVAQSPEVRRVIEQELGMVAGEVVNGYVFYRVPEHLRGGATATRTPCSLPFGTGY